MNNSEKVLVIAVDVSGIWRICVCETVQAKIA